MAAKLFGKPLELDRGLFEIVRRRYAPRHRNGFSRNLGRRVVLVAHHHRCLAHLVYLGIAIISFQIENILQGHHAKAMGRRQGKLMTFLGKVFWRCHIWQMPGVLDFAFAHASYGAAQLGGRAADGGPEEHPRTFLVALQ